jgi:stage 0 sporulation protein J
MAKFDKAGVNKSFGEVSKKAAEKATVITIQNINTENLLDNPENGEDVSMIEDLELSMRENGFTDPIEVTDFEQEAGKYMILSGHRRRQAGLKVGITVFPCIVRHFQTKNEVKNYMLLSNAQRDSAKDPFLFSKRYKLHEQYLMESGFKGKVREEVAKRLGLSVQQADRYNMMNKIILPVWDMVKEEKVGMSSVQPMASHSIEEQKEILVIMEEALRSGMTLTRDTMKKLIDGYRDGKRTWDEITSLSRDSELPLNGAINPEIGEMKDPAEERDRNDEVRRDPIEATEEDANECEEEREHEKKLPLTEEEKQIKRGKDIMAVLHKLDTTLSEIYKFEDKESGLGMLDTMGSTVSVLIDEMKNLSEEFGAGEDFNEKCSVIKGIIEQYI